MAGIEDLKDVVRFGLKLGQGISLSLEDGKITWGDVGSFLPAIIEVPSVISGIENVGEELRDLDDQEQAELEQLVQEEFDVPSEHAKEVVAQSIKAAVELIQLIELLS